MIYLVIGLVRLLSSALHVEPCLAVVGRQRRSWTGLVQIDQGPVTCWGEGHRKLSTDLRQGNAGDLISFGDLIYRVVLISECPIAFMMAKGSAPAMAVCDPKVWRRRIVFWGRYFDHSLSQRQSRQPSSFCQA